MMYMMLELIGRGMLSYNYIGTRASLADLSLRLRGFILVLPGFVVDVIGFVGSAGLA